MKATYSSVIPADKIQPLRNCNMTKAVLRDGLVGFFFLTVIIDVSFAQLPEANLQFHIINQTFNAKQD